MQDSQPTQSQDIPLSQLTQSQDIPQSQLTQSQDIPMSQLTLSQDIPQSQDIPMSQLVSSKNLPKPNEAVDDEILYKWIPVHLAEAFKANPTEPPKDFEFKDAAWKRIINRTFYEFNEKYEKTAAFSDMQQRSQEITKREVERFTGRPFNDAERFRNGIYKEAFEIADQVVYDTCWKVYTDARNKKFAAIAKKRWQLFREEVLNLANRCVLASLHLYTCKVILAL